MSTLAIDKIDKHNVVTIDFETYYGDKYSLTSKDMNTSEYIRDDRFKVHMVGIKIGEQPTKVYLEHEVEAALKSIDWDKHALLCHNTAFDGFIMSHHYGILPALYLDTLSMSRALHGPNTRHNLDTIAKRYGFAGKVREKALSNTKNLRDLSERPDLIASLSEYCADDVNDTHGIFWKMYDSITDKELQLIDITIRAFCDPVLLVDIPRVEAELNKEVAGKVTALLLSSSDRETLLSAEKFANALRAYGVTPPMKISKTTGKPTYAFAATDRGFMALSKHSDKRVVALHNARLTVKSTIGETRAGRFLEAGRDGMALPVLLHYCGAHTFRWSGGNKMNLQNLVRGGELRRSLLAPPGHVIVVSDSAQIEARLNAWLSDELGLLDTFRAYDRGEGPDAYRIMASMIYNVPIDKVTDAQRFVGKVCVLALGYGMGEVRLKDTLETGAMGAPVALPEAEYAKAKYTYRYANKNIVRMWDTAKNLLYKMIQANGTQSAGEYKCLKFGKDFVKLPNGMFLRYPGLRSDDTGSLVYDTINGEARIYGGLFVENLVQALARVIIADQMLAIHALGYRIVTMTHDEIVVVCHEDKAEQCKADMERVMSTPPVWAPTIPLSVKCEYDTCYSK